MMQWRNLLDKQLTYTWNNYKQNPMFDITETVNKTYAASDKNSSLGLYNDLIRYNSGFCDFNQRLSHGLKLSEDDTQYSKNIDKLVELTEPTEKNLYLFHGFEFGMKYGENKWKPGDKVRFDFHLSKTPGYFIAMSFTNHFMLFFGTIFHPFNTKNKNVFSRAYDLLVEKNLNLFQIISTIFFRKYLFCIYDKPSKHISTDIRAPHEIVQNKPSVIYNEEFEYLSHKGEEFVFLGVKYKFRLFYVEKFYVMHKI
jgi:hypothetical protein